MQARRDVRRRSHHAREVGWPGGYRIGVGLQIGGIQARTSADGWATSALIGADTQDQDHPGRIARALQPRRRRSRTAPICWAGAAMPATGRGPARRFPRPVARSRPFGRRAARRHRVPQPHRARPRQRARLTIDEVRLGGGAAKIGAWAQIKADVLRRAISTVMPANLAYSAPRSQRSSSQHLHDIGNPVLHGAHRVQCGQPEKRDFM